MTVTVEAGCTLAALDRVLAASDQWLPLDPPEPARDHDRRPGRGEPVGPAARRRRARYAICSSGCADLARRRADLGRRPRRQERRRLRPARKRTSARSARSACWSRPPSRSGRARRASARCCSPVATRASAVEVALEARDVVDPAWLEIATPDVVAVRGVGPLGVRRLARACRGGRGRGAPRPRAGRPRHARGHRRDARRRGRARCAPRLADVALTPDAAVLRAATLPDALGSLLDEATRLARTPARRRASPRTPRTGSPASSCATHGDRHHAAGSASPRARSGRRLAGRRARGACRQELAGDRSAVSSATPGPGAH